MSIINLQDTKLDIVMKMSKGHPGAVIAIMELITKSPKIDPQSALGGYGPILSLDTHEIYGSDVYFLWNNKCHRDVRKVCVLLRAVQLGFLAESKLQEMAADQMREVNLTDEEFATLDEQVCCELSDFKKAEKGGASC